jgi:hypothetical protein
MKVAKFKILLLFNLITAMALAQSPAGINGLISKIDAYNSAVPVEKVFMQFDKPYYSSGDTIWFKSYIVNEALAYSPLSSRLYVELRNDSNAVVKRFVFPASLGLTWGNIPLDQTYVREGTYTIRAYTSWMRNFGEDYFFKQSFYLNNQGYNTWLINTKPSMDAATGNVKLDLKFTGLDGLAASNSDIELKVMNGKKALSRSSAQTGSDGTMNVNFTLPAQTILKNLAVVANHKKNKRVTALIPVKVNRPQDVDIQFMPESGQLVSGITSRVGFKAIGEDGKSIAVQGTVYDNEHNKVAAINVAHNGMGAFDMTPVDGKTYTADITLTGGANKTVSLPVPLKTGSTMSVKNSRNKDTLSVAVYNTAEPNSQNKYYLIGMSRGVICYGASFVFNNNYFAAKVAKSLFPTGIAHFILLNATQQPLNERVTFVDHNDHLKINITTSASNFKTRDSIPVQITVTDKAGKPVRGSFSLAVTDNNQVKPESVASNNIVSHLLLAADLKGYIEDPAFYMEHTEQSWQALDALLLTQGWVGYDLEKINKPVKLAYEPEKEFMVKGTVTNLFNKPVSNSKVVLLSKGEQNFFKDTTADKVGKFAFAKFPQIGKSAFIISARNDKGKIINGGISIDEKNLSPASSAAGVQLAPWNVNTDTTVVNYIKTNRSYQLALDKAQHGASGNRLKQVDINDKVLIKNSQNLNDPATNDQTLDEEVMVNAGKASLLDVIQSKVKGFTASFYKDKAKHTNMEYFIKDKRVHFVFDGVELDRFYDGVTGQPNEHYEFVKQYLDYISAEDILGIEVIYTNNGRYKTAIPNVSDMLAADPAGPRGADIAYLEITTRAGTGPNIQRATGVYIYKPLQIAEYKKFYKPNYLVNKADGYIDMRSTIDWEPNIITNASGAYTIKFYAADKPTQYTILCEGSDMNGEVGVQTKVITISGNK